MNLSKREGVIRTLELDDNIDKLPVHYLVFKLKSISYQTFLKTKEYKDYYTFIENNFLK